MAAEQLTDKENQFRKRARRRLVGAVALVLLMVTVLPMVLDEHADQRAAQPEIAINIPSQDGTDFSSKIVPLSAPVNNTSAPGIKLNPDQALANPTTKNSPVSQPDVASLSPQHPPQPSEKPKKETTATLGNIPPKAVSAPQTLPNMVDSTKVTEPKVTESVVAEPKAEPSADSPLKLAKPIANDGKATVSVQVGVFSDAAKVKKMRATIAEQGIKCHSDVLNTPKGEKYRVRCGPFPSKAAAQQSLVKIKTAGYDGMLVTSP